MQEASTQPVSLRGCTSYDYAQVKSALALSVSDIGGFSPYIKPGERVLLKVNILRKARPEEAVTTNPVFVRALAELLKEYGATVLIGDSPGGPFNESYLRSIYKLSGIEEAASLSGATLNFNFNSIERSVPDGKLVKRLSVCDMLNDVDKVISVSKLKTHAMMTYTGAVKNLFGCIPGLKKMDYHLNMSEYDRFADILIDICLCVAPVLSFTDGIVAMEGDGPADGTPTPMNVVLASPSPYALDKIACALIGLNVSAVPVLKQAVTRGLLSDDLSDTKLIGDPMESFVRKDFKMPKESRLGRFASRAPNWLKRISFFRSKPRVEAHCTGCGICRQSCPADAIMIQHRAGYKRAKIDYSKCIRCLCCHELCPQHAMKLK